MAVDSGVTREAQAIMAAARLRVPRAIQGLKAMHRLSDARLGALVGLSRQQVQARLTGETDISQQELAAFAFVLQTDVQTIYEMAAKLPPVNHRYPEQPPLPIFIDAAA